MLFTLLKSLSFGQEFWGLWGILTAWLVGDRSVHTTRFWISRRREKWQELCERNSWVDVFHCKHGCGAEKGPSRLFVCYYVVKNIKKAAYALLRRSFGSLLHFAATPVSALIGCSSFLLSLNNWIFSIVISICCWPPNWCLFTVNVPGLPSRQLTQIWGRRTKTSWQPPQLKSFSVCHSVLSRCVKQDQSVNKYTTELLNGFVW